MMNLLEKRGCHIILGKFMPFEGVRAHSSLRRQIRRYQSSIYVLGEWTTMSGCITIWRLLHNSALKDRPSCITIW